MKQKIIAFIVSLLLLVGCSTVPTFVSHGIPNLRVVDATQTIYRGGQPDTNGFAYLKSIGISNVVKLNLNTEKSKCSNGECLLSSDSYAKVLGMEVVYIPIDTDDQLFHLPKWKFDKAVASITPGTFVHCEHGQDRTGLIVAGYQMSKGMPKADAEKEMLADGFHKALFGLWEFFKHLKQ